MKRIIIFALILAALGGGGWYFWKGRQKEEPRSYRTARAERGTVVQTVKATGIVRPVLSVQVGTQVNGPVRKLYVDYNDRVKVGDLVAQIDPTVYEARFAQDQANLLQSKASLEQAHAKLVQAEKDLVRARELAKRDLLSQADLDAAVAGRDTLAAQVKVAEASVEQAKAAIQISQANLGYTTIRSPVDGVVIARNVDEGQTVVASMTAQTLFQIATDLKRVQVEASIPEADIGNVREGQPVNFTVDAYDLEFTGVVAQIRLAASTMQNVVTYPVVINADNPELKLFPGMTANISCEVARREDALRIPNAALRFKPDPSELVPGGGNGPGGAGAGSGGWRGRAGEGGGPGGSATSRQKVWILDAASQKPKPVPVHAGINDGAFTEVKERSRPAGEETSGHDVPKLTEEDDIILGYGDAGAGAPAAPSTVNPFVPQRPRGGRPH